MIDRRPSASFRPPPVWCDGDTSLVGGVHFYGRLLAQRHFQVVD